MTAALPCPVLPEMVEIDLGPSRTHKGGRMLIVAPAPPGSPPDCVGAAEIVTSTGPKATPRSEVYAIRRLRPSPDWGEGVALRLDKCGSGDCRNLFLSPEFGLSTCDCEGFTYAAAERAAVQAGEELPGLPCKQLDLAAAMYSAGLILNH